MNLSNNIIIGIDTSCYTTSIAAISLDRNIIFDEKIMLKVKENERGLRQSEAVFQHTKHLGEISYKIRELNKEFNIKAICVSSKPRPIDNSYMPVFTVGNNFAKLMGSLINCPVYETTHQENHIEASLYKNEIKNKNKFISIHMSGGTTEILLVDKENISIVGGSKDISFGQLLDRIGVKLGYDFPCGKYIDVNAIKCEEKITQGLKTSTKEGYMNLSGIENQINKMIESKDYSNEYLSKLLLESIIKNTYKTLTYICNKYEVNEVVFAGGVSASKYINNRLTKELRRENIHSYFTEAKYSTDNALGCAIIGMNKFLGE